MAITFNPTSLTLRVGYKSSVVASSTGGNITSVVSSDATVATVTGGTGAAVGTFAITCLKGGVINIQVSNGSETVNFPLTVLGIDTSFVGSMIGRASSDIATLCTYAGINKWSKFKPMIATHPLTDATIKTAKSGLTLAVDYFSTMRTYALNNFNFSQAAVTPQKTWPFAALQSNHIKDLSDFRGYAHGSQPIFSIPYNANLTWVTNGGSSNPKSLNIVQPDQVTGGLVPADIFDSNHHLGLMLVNLESDAQEIAMVAINAASIVSTQTITVDVTNINTSNYIVCLFIYEGTPGITQVNYPSAGQLNDIDQYGVVIPIENGMIPVFVNNFYAFPIMLWRYIGADLRSNGCYTLTLGADAPEIINDKMIWTSFYDNFHIFPDIDPSVNIKMELEVKLYHDNSNWVNNGVYRTLISWLDIDGFTVSLCMKTDSYGIITLGLYSSETESFLEEVETDNVLSTSALSPNTLLIKSNPFTISLDSTNWMTPVVGGIYENPSAFYFGKYTDISGPYGLGFTSIELIATGSY